MPAHRYLTLFLLAALALFAWPALGAEESAAAAFADARQAIQRGAFTEAIDGLELLADRGIVHPDASFNRAVAYVERSRSSAAAPGDLGRAVAALSETLILRPNDTDADNALTRIRAEISRRHTREGTAPVMARPSLGRAATSLFDENVWAVLAVTGSLLLTLGIALRRFVPRTSAQLAGAIGIGLGILLLLVGGGMTAGARHFRTSSAPAVVVVPEARLCDETGKPLPAKAGAADSVTLPEGASVYVLERRPTLYRVEWGSSQGWVTPGQLRVLATH